MQRSGAPAEYLVTVAEYGTKKSSSQTNHMSTFADFSAPLVNLAGLPRPWSNNGYANWLSHINRCKTLVSEAIRFIGAASSAYEALR